ncbi:MAG: hypothetical protein M1503_02720 [Thaumarchaeota archaeon]|nr:hypothetical protein [Nitrososphaerota archaeon]MCL5317164.1 hypothetical protein [Nitrososphaerota archaeon]
MYTNDTTRNGVVKAQKIDGGQPAFFGAAKVRLRQMGRHSIKTVKRVAPKLASTAVITLLIASIFPLTLFTVTPSILPKAAATEPNIIFQNGFEAGTNTTNWDWKSNVHYGTISNDNNIFFGGIRSFKFAATAYNGDGFVHGSNNFSKITNTLWMQMYVRIDPYPSGSDKMVEIFELKNSTGSIAAVRLYSSSTGVEKIQLKRYIPSVQYDYSTDLNLASNRWYRLEFKLYRNSTAGQYQVYLNGSPVINITNVNTASSATVPASMNVGATIGSHSSSSWTLWADDVSISNTTRIPSVKPQDPIFQDGFESGNATKWDWTSSGNGGTISYDTSVKFNGTYSFKLAATQTNSYGYAHASKNFTQIGNTVTVQMWVRISSLPSGSGKMVEILELKNSTGPIAGVRLYSPGAGRAQIELKRYIPSVQYDHSADLNITSNSWFKLVFKLYRNSTAGQYHIYINDSLVISIKNLNTDSLATVPASMNVGATIGSHSSSSWTLWVDTVSVSRRDPWLYDRRYVAGYMTANGCPSNTFCTASEAKAAISFPNTSASVIPSGEFLEGSINLKASDNIHDGLDYSIRATHNLYPNGTHAVVGEMWETCDGLSCNTFFPYKTLLYKSLLKLDGLSADQTVYVRIRVIGDDRVRWWYSYNGTSWTEYGIYTPPTTFNEYLQIGTNPIYFGPYFTAYGYQFAASSSSMVRIPGSWSVKIAQPSYNRSLTWTVVPTAKIIQGTHSLFSEDWKYAAFPYNDVWANYPTADQSVTFYYRLGYFLPDHDTLWGG